MKKMLVAGVLALALTATSHQQASAWCKFNFSAGFNISYESTGSCYGWGFSCVPNPPPCGYNCNPGCAPTCYAGYPGTYGYPTMFGAYGYAGQGAGYAAPAAAPAAPAAAPAVSNASRTQPVGYYFYSQGYAPSYWYGN